MKNSPYRQAPRPLAVALRTMLADTEAKIAIAAPAEKARLQQRAGAARGDNAEINNAALDLVAGWAGSTILVRPCAAQRCCPEPPNGLCVTSGGLGPFASLWRLPSVSKSECLRQGLIEGRTLSGGGRIPGLTEMVTSTRREQASPAA